jgi:hypothetical protein
MMIFKTETFRPDMSGEIIPISPVRQEPVDEVIQKPKEQQSISYAQSYQDIQNENYQKALKTKQQLEEAYKGDENGIVDYDKITELNYQLLCQGMWLSNIHKSEYITH